MEAVYVVVGGGIAGVSCVEALSLLLPPPSPSPHEASPSIILISASPLVKAVTRVTPLTKMLAEFAVEEKSCDYVSAAYPSVRVVVDSATRIDPVRRTVYTAGHLAIRYRKLCLCTGAAPRLIEAGSQHVFGIRDTDSAQRLEEKLKRARRIVVVGNGGIATELVHEVKGVEIVWAVKDKHISAAFVDAGAAEFFQDCLREKGAEENTVAAAGGGSGAAAATTSVVKTVKYTVDDDSSTKPGEGAALGPSWHDRINLVVADRPGTKVSVEYEVEVRRLSYACGGEWPVCVELSNGKTVDCDFVVSATGVTPNSDAVAVVEGAAAEALDLAADKGIRVDECMRTNLADVYAAGDVCTASWTPARHWFQMRLWTQARQMGAYAARCMVESVRGEPTIADFCFEMFTHVTRFFGYKVVLLGLFNGQTLGRRHELLLRVTPKHEYVKLVVADGKVQGAVLIGETDLEEMCENLILNQLDVSEFGEDLLNPDIDIEDYFD